MRLTGDCPLADPEIIGRVVQEAHVSDADYVSSALHPTFPDGMDAECLRLECLEQAWREARLPSEREHVTAFVYNRPDRFRLGEVRNDADLSALRWTVDEPSDFVFVSQVYEHLYRTNPAFGMRDILALLERQPSLARINTGITRNEGYLKSLRADAQAPPPRKPRMRSFTQLEQLLQRAEQVIPLGSQTFSKSRTQYPSGVSPYFISRGKGSRVWDVDGNEYTDYINALASVTLGYDDPDVTRAVEQQLHKGTIFSLPSEIEIEVAERIVRLVPCAEKVRFGKNGSDATSGAVRIARAATGRDHVAVCGYHGWQDWYIGSTARHLGVPSRARRGRSCGLSGANHISTSTTTSGWDFPPPCPWNG